MEAAEVTCPHCNATRVIPRMMVEHFSHGVGPDRVELEAWVEVRFCQDCREAWTEWDAAQAREVAVRRYLGVKEQEGYMDVGCLP